MAIEAYPLTWPRGWKRTAAGNRKQAAFNKKVMGVGDWKRPTNLSVADGLGRVLNELEMLRINRNDVIVSTNLTLRLDGLPRSDQKMPADPGAAVYWRAKSDQPMKCMAIDRYTTVADNLAAIAASLEAFRAIERHGGAEILDRAFTGFKALAAENAGPSWWEVLQIDALATEPEIQAAYRRLAKIAHSDTAFGSDVAMVALNVARDQALAAVKGRA